MKFKKIFVTNLNLHGVAVKLDENDDFTWQDII